MTQPAAWCCACYVCTVKHVTLGGHPDVLVQRAVADKQALREKMDSAERRVGWMEHHNAKLVHNALTAAAVLPCRYTS